MRQGLLLANLVATGAGQQKRRRVINGRLLQWRWVNAFYGLLWRMFGPETMAGLEEERSFGE